MRFEKFLLEGSNYEGSSGRVKSLSEDEFIKLLTTKCKNAIKSMESGNYIYRGDRNQGIFFEGNGALSTRLSRNTSNYYTLWMDNHPQWSQFPKRSKSFICTNDEYYASGFGNNMKIVIPFDGVDIGVCSNNDLWDSFPQTMKNGLSYSMDDFNNMVESFINMVLGTYNNRYDGSWSEYKKVIEKVDKDYDMEHIIRTTEYQGSVSDFSQLVKKHGSLMKTLEELMSPKSNDFSLVKNPAHLPADNHELWMEGPILMVSRYELGKTFYNWMYDKGIIK